MSLDVFIQELTATLKSGTEEDILKLMYYSDKTFEGFNNAGAGNLFKKMLLYQFNMKLHIIEGSKLDKFEYS
ncbi:hypothetical protein [Nostoc sp.]|uniref:hypothetical protein n=1 Tax=Nostoc sp. TaxID=1180 RepID=UPI002FFCCCCF